MDIIISGNWLDYNFEGEDKKATKAVACLFGTREAPADVCTDADRVSDYLCSYGVTTVPWKVTLDLNGNVLSSCALLIDSVSSIEVNDADGSSIEEFFQKGIDASNADNFADAASWFTKVLQYDPSHSDALFNMSSLLHMHGFPILSIRYIEKLLTHSPDDMVLHSFLWALTQSPGGTREACVAAYRRLAGSGGGAMVKHKLAALTGEGGESQLIADPNYARQIFDDMAPVFEHRLVEDLGYKCPWTMREALEALLAEGTVPRPESGWRVLDLGCGSGLCGRVLQDIIFPDTAPASKVLPAAEGSLEGAVRVSGATMIGIDVSARMVELTLRNGGYSFAFTVDMRRALDTCAAVVEGASSSSFDMMICADTFLYVGCLGEILHLANLALRKGGLFMFSTESLDTSPMRKDPLPFAAQEQEGASAPCHEPMSCFSGVQMLRSARFAHSDEYIREVSAMHNFECIKCQDIVVRTEATDPLPGKIFILRKP